MIWPELVSGSVTVTVGDEVESWGDTALKDDGVRGDNAGVGVWGDGRACVGVWGDGGGNEFGLWCVDCGDGWLLLAAVVFTCIVGGVINLGEVLITFGTRGCTAPIKAKKYILNISFTFLRNPSSSF